MDSNEKASVLTPVLVKIHSVAMAGGFKSDFWKTFLSLANLPPFLCPLFCPPVSRNGWYCGLSGTWEEADVEGQVASSGPVWKPSPPAGENFLFQQIILTKLWERFPDCASWFFHPIKDINSYLQRTPELITSLRAWLDLYSCLKQAWEKRGGCYKSADSPSIHAASYCCKVCWDVVASSLR